jgi:hypothetical protein
MTKNPLELQEGSADPGAEIDENDPVVEECLRDALGPFLPLMSPEDVLEHRRFLTVFITTHPTARPLYERALEARRQRLPTATSGEVAKDGVVVEGAAEILGDGTLGRR